MQIITSWMEQSLEQGRQETQTTIALNLLRKKMPLEMIAAVTGLTIAQLQQLQVDPLID